MDLAYGNALHTVCQSSNYVNPFRTLIHYDQNDALVWTLDSLRVHDMEHDETGGIVFVGDAHIHADLDPGPGVTTVAGGLKVIASYRADGTLRFAHRLPTGSSYFQRVALAKDGSVVAVGEFQQPFDLDPTSEIAWIEPIFTTESSTFLARYDSLGTLVDHQVFDSRNMSSIEHVVLSDNHVYLLCGSFNATGEPMVAAIRTLTDSIVVQRNEPYAFVLLCFNVQLDLEFAHVVDCNSGSVGSRLFKLGQDRMLLYGQGSMPYDLDPGPATVGTASGGRFMAEYGQEWAYHWNGTFPIGVVNVQGAVLDGLNRLYIAGNIQGTADIDPTDGEVLGSTTTNSLMYVVKLNSVRLTEWAIPFGSEVYSNLRGIYLDDELVLYFSANGMMDVQPGPSSMYVGCPDPGVGAVIAHYTVNELSTSLSGSPIPTDLRILPNPASDVVQIEAPAPFDLTLFDANGRLIISKAYTDPRSIIQVADLAEGLYVVQVRTANSVVSRTLVIQH
ncbi:MAG: T9SS type A sorting domain-containing protein [Flavobacteriales bacterium]|nr:T9SS type A sorting domain-containing protein [Flavobacteriales bacterium]